MELSERNRGSWFFLLFFWPRGSNDRGKFMNALDETLMVCFHDLDSSEGGELLVLREGFAGSFEM